MVRVPWRGFGGDDGENGEDGDEEEGDRTPADGIGVDPVVSCEFQHATLFVYEDHVHVERARRSNFDDRSIPLDEVRGIEYSEGITVGYLQVRQEGFDHDEGGWLSAPVDGNTCHFRRRDRECARRARDAILERARGN